MDDGTFGSGVHIQDSSNHAPTSSSTSQSEPLLPTATGGGVQSKWAISDGLLTFIDDDDSEEFESEHYTIVRKITGGMYGEVFEGISKQLPSQNGEQLKVAVKKVSMHGKYYRLHADREANVLSKISHTNVIQLLSSTQEGGYTVLLLELCKTDLYIMQQNNVLFDLEEVRSIALMALSGLKAVHDLGIMHRDMKPGNLLITEDGIVKVCDFGLARCDNEEPPFTLQISTKWYKALEVLLGEKKYDKKVDIWAMGAILAELVSGKVLFNGNCDLHVLSEIFQVMGSEHYQKPEWVERKTYPQYGYFIWSEREPADLSHVCGTEDHMFLDLLKQMLVFSVAARPSIDDCLAHDWLKTANTFNSSLRAKAREKYDIPKNF